MIETSWRSDQRHRFSVCRAFQELHRRGLTIASLGNVSVRDGEQVWITPTSTPPYEMDASDVCVVSVDGACVSDCRPSRELPLHLEVYRQFPMVGAVVHTHSPWATAWSYRCEDLDLQTEELEYHQIRRIRWTPRASAGSPLLAKSAAETLRDAPVALLGQHGVVAMGPDTNVAMCLAELAEQQAHIQWLLRLEAPLPSLGTDLELQARHHIG